MKDLKISKELLSEVLNYEVDVFLGINKNEIDYTCCRDENEGYVDISINLYEFAFKCKEWALNYMVDKEIQSTGCIISSWTHTGGSGHARILVIDEKFTANTEPEAIIRACEWIQENIK